MNKRAPVKLEVGKRASIYIIRICIVLFVLVLLQLFRWQVIDNERFSALASAQLSQQEQIFTKRGTIYTRDEVILAVDSPAWDVVLSLTNQVDQSLFTQTVADVERKYAEVLAKTKDNDKTSVIASINERKNKEIAKTKERVFAEIAGVVGESTISLDEAYMPNALSYQIIFKGITKRQKEILEEKKLHGIYTNESVKRLYPNGKLFAHVIGYVGTDSFGRPQGNYGVEGFFWGDIKGKEGASQQEKDLSGKAIISKSYKNIQYREGKNIVLTVNSGVQKKVERILAEGVRSQKGETGTVIIMNPKTGEIIAMASYPDYDPNEFWKNKNIATFRNQAVSNPYEYGSVQKPLTIAMAMDLGKLKETDICNDKGVLVVQDSKVYNYDFKRYGKITPKETLAHSDNICAATYGLSVGAAPMHSYLLKLGIGTQIGIGIDEEETSFLKAPEKWLAIDTATTAYGQAISATPLQVLSALSTIANKGERMQPMLVKKIFNNEDEIIINPTSLGKVFTSKTADSVAKMMEYAIMTRNDMNKYSGVYSIAGKTGTAQVAKSDASGYYDDKVNVTFVGFSPAIDARFIMLVKVENPRSGGLANLTVLPLWIKLFDAIKDDLGVPRIK
jgi:cell division protein FtsI (penicillin-binding protein 3)/stage V sporulation protein D (sporulation-specific penicillin-binding protein)